MKLNEGRIGRQEAASLAAMGLVSSAVFYPNAAEGYRYGNANYFAAPLAFLLLLLLFFVIVRSMKRRGAEHLGAFLTDALGGLFGRVAALAVVAFLVLSAAIPLIQFQLLLKRFVFPDSLVSTICLYFLPPMLLLACMGLETLGRTARMLFWLFAIAFVLPMLIPISAFETYHLFPLPMENPVSIVQSAVRMAAQGMPAVLALLIYADGVQGVRNAERYRYGNSLRCRISVCRRASALQNDGHWRCASAGALLFRSGGFAGAARQQKHELDEYGGDADR